MHQFILDDEFVNVIPPLCHEEKAQLEANILESGCREPLVVWKERADMPYVLLDGHNRHEICARHNLPFTTTEAPAHIDSRAAARIWMRGNQAGRRNINDAWKLEMALANKADLAEIGRAKKVESGKEARDKQLGVLSTNDKTPEPAHNTQKEIAKAAGVSTGKVAQAEVVKKKAPEIWEKAKGGEMTVGQAYKEVKSREKKEQRQEKVREIAEKNTALETHKKYCVIYADPPWRYEFSKSDSREIENQYPTMSLDEICALPVGAVAADDSVLFMWTTSPKLRESFSVLDAWGFEYKTCAVWDKQKIGMGYYFRQQHEILLVATRGSLPAPEPEARPSSVISASRGKHSAKPAEVYELLEVMYPFLPKIELFCRSPRDGWDVWGNQSHAA